jgi:hypothetical protein
MTHILLSGLLIGFSTVISLRRHGAELGYLVLSWVPLALLAIARAYEILFGFQRFAEVIYHFAYDTSYILSLIGMMLLLISVFRRTPKGILLAAILLSLMPIALMMLSQSR